MIRFGEFALEPGERRLTRNGETLDVQGRYFDALHLLAREPGSLVTKDRFMDEVWRGVPVTDEALTQCIRALRKALGDDAARPRFIETVPKYGYRFVAPVEGAAAVPAPEEHDDRRLRLWLAGMVGGGAAGLVGGIAYGLVAASAVGALSLLLVLAGIVTLTALIGAAGVSAGLALAERRAGEWLPVGGALGGAIVGALFHLLSMDAFRLLTGQSPGAVAGGLEGLILGGAVGFAALIARRSEGALGGAGNAGLAALCGALGGGLIAATGGRLMGASLAELAGRFAGADLSFARLGALFGEPDFGDLTRYFTSAAEGALFASAIISARWYASRR